jgi:hypothetical protein
MVVWQQPAENEWLQEIGRVLTLGRGLPTPAEGTPGPFALADPARVSAVLGDAGFGLPDLQPVSSALWWGADVAAAGEVILGMFGWLLPDGPADRERAVENLTALLAEHLGEGGVEFGSAAWLVAAERG